MDARRDLSITAIGDGERRVDVLVVPGIFESIQLAKAVAARLEADRAADANSDAARLLATFQVEIRCVVPPGYERDRNVRAFAGAADWPDVLPTNSEYLRRIRDAEARAPADALRVVFHHSWGGGVAAPLWGDTTRRRPHLAILSAPAWSDLVTFSARAGGRLLALPGAGIIAERLVPLSLRELSRTGIPTIVDLARGLPVGFSSREVAYRSYIEVCRLPALRSPAPPPAVPRAGERVVLAQGTRDRAVRGRQALARYDELCAQDADWRGIELVRGKFEHWPFLETSQLLATTLLRELARLDRAARGAGSA